MIIDFSLDNIPPCSTLQQACSIIESNNALNELNNVLSLVKIFDVSVPDPSRILSGSFKDMLLFPEESTLS